MDMIFLGFCELGVFDQDQAFAFVNKMVAQNVFKIAFEGLVNKSLFIKHESSQRDLEALTG